MAGVGGWGGWPGCLWERLQGPGESTQASWGHSWGQTYSKGGQQPSQGLTIRFTFRNGALGLWGQVRQKRSPTKALAIV